MTTQVFPEVHVVPPVCVTPPHCPHGPTTGPAAGAVVDAGGGVVVEVLMVVNVVGALVGAGLLVVGATTGPPLTASIAALTGARNLADIFLLPLSLG